jgi:hypothetical protein
MPRFAATEKLDRHADLAAADSLWIGGVLQKQCQGMYQWKRALPVPRLATKQGALASPPFRDTLL